MSDNRLIDIAARYRETFEKLGDLDLDDKAVRDTLEGMEGELAVKVFAVCHFIEQAVALGEFEEKLIKRHQERKSAIENRVAGMKTYVIDSLLFAGVKEIGTQEGKVRVRYANPTVKVENAKLIPMDFMRFPDPPSPEPDKQAILAALKAGTAVPGCSLADGKPWLEIR
jgi:hypothetical protein